MKDFKLTIILFIGIILGVIGIGILALGSNVEIIFPDAFSSIIKSIIFIFSCLLGILIFVMGVAFADTDNFSSAFKKALRVLKFFVGIPNEIINRIKKKVAS